MRALLLACLLPIAAVASDGYVRVPGGDFTTTLQYEDVRGPSHVATFEMMTRPVTNAEFRTFVQRIRSGGAIACPAVFAGHGYLDHWQGSLQLAERTQGAQPVTRVSWFAAKAYCEAQGARLPAVAGVGVRGGRRWGAPRRAPRRAWRDRILQWYAQPASQPLPAAANERRQRLRRARPARCGVGMDGRFLVDARDLGQSYAGRPRPQSEFCGAGALSVADREQYAVLMRVALLSSLEGRDSTSTLGFRCVGGAVKRFIEMPLRLACSWALMLLASRCDGDTDRLGLQRGRRADRCAIASLSLGRVARSPRIVSMFYTSCTFTCPTLIDGVKVVLLALPPDERSALGVTMISLDPKRDTPAVLAKLQKDLIWILRTGPWRGRSRGRQHDRCAARNPLSRTCDGDFNHTTALVLLDGEGRIVATTDNIGRPVDREFLAAIRKTLAAH